MILNPSEFKDKFAFVIEKANGDRQYHCLCGEKFIKNIHDQGIFGNSELGQQRDFSLNEKIKWAMNGYENFAIEEDEDGIFDDLKIAMKEVSDSEIQSIICPSCNRNYKEDKNIRRIIPVDFFFISGYKMQETDDFLSIYNCRVKNIPTQNSDDISFFEEYKSLKLDKKNKTIHFKDYRDDKEKELDLNEIINKIQNFFHTNTNTVINIIDIHLFINSLASQVLDAKNINIINDLLENIRGRMNEIGEEYIQKIVSIFFGIIKYSNLSTIAMTKSSVFLYDLMLKCDIPSSKEMQESNATSPVKIFNFLIKNYIRKINENVNADNRDVHNFVFKSEFYIDQETGEKHRISKEQSLNITAKQTEGYTEGKVVKTKDGRHEVLTLSEDANISGFIYKKINKFSDFEKLIKYLKFINKNQLIDLLQKFDKDLLVSSVDILFFRDIDGGFEEMKRILNIIASFCQDESKKRWDFEGEMQVDYEHALSFSFIEYDDSNMLLELLKFDPKRYFAKIKNHKQLLEYHNNLVKYNKALNEENKHSDSMMKFVSKFKYLESREHYNGPLRIKLLYTPGEIIREGIEMQHSASAYARRVAQGQYLLGQVWDEDINRPENEPQRFTIGFAFSSANHLEFEQVKGKANIIGSERFKRLVIEWLKDLEISFRMGNDIKLKEEDIKNVL